MNQVCFELTGGAFPIRLTQTGMRSFTVQYGKQIERGLSYSTAAAKLGQAIMHAAACDGKLDNSATD